MKKLLLVIPLLLIFGFGMLQTNCKGKEKNSEPAVKGDANTTMTVSFISKGSGIDHVAFTAVEAIVKELQPKCAFDSKLINYGREGERQYCLANLSASCKKELLAAIAALPPSELVQVKENGTCRK